MARINGSVSNYVGNYAYYLDVYEIQTDVTNNRSIVRVDVWLTSGTRSWDSISAVGGTVTINGGQHNFSKVVSIGAGGKVVLATCDAWVYHNATGGGSIGISSTFSPTSSWSPGYCQASGTYTLSTIPRASTPSMGAFKAGDNVTVSISRASSSFTHSLTLKVGGTTIKTASGVGTSQTWSFSEADVKSIYTAMGSATSATATVTCVTYSGSTNIGTKSATATCSQVGGSTLTTTPNTTVGDSLALSITRDRATVTHTLRFYAGSTLVRTASGVGAAYTFTPTTAEIGTIYGAMGSANSVTFKVTCAAAHYARSLGTSEKSGTASAPGVSTITSSPAHTIGNGYTVTLTRTRSAVTHTVELYVGNTKIRTGTNVGTSYAYTPTAAEISAEYAATPNSNTATAKIVCRCYHYDHLCGTVQATGNATVDAAAAAPVFTGFVFADINAVTTALTGNDQQLISGYSTLRATVPVGSKATSTTGATIKQYILYCGGASISGTYSATADVSMQLTSVTSGSIRVAAVDSRGNQTVIERLAVLVPYTPPRITKVTLRRDSGVDAKTQLELQGVWWTGSFGAVDNAVSASYQYRGTADKDLSASITIPITTEGAEFKYIGYIDGDLGTGGFTFDRSFYLLFTTADLLASATAEGTIDRGVPTMHMTQTGIGIGKMHESGSIDTVGNIVEAGTALPDKYAAKAHGHTALTSLGNQTPESGRTANRGGVYSYNVANGVAGAPADYLSVLGFGRGAGGSVEIAGQWTAGQTLYARALRDMQDNWWPWVELITSKNLLNKVYPVGSIYMSMVNTSPQSFLGGTWAAIAPGRVLVGVNTSDGDFNAPNKSGGSKTITVAQSNLPPRTMVRVSLSGQGGAQPPFGAVTGWANTTMQDANLKNSQAIKTVPPYLTCYMWRRTA
ncbi:Phage-related holin (Lysis protein) [Anaerotruncus sp. 2789STDY5834896]|uniref:Phage-related holin (Lysis protein) n=1 Tax=uncultured Anaerotruncus sp. TaxID=905011 RepID=A0A1C6G2L4_9FIRM|nr:Phage-related holin (Lysis protein) [uncultured Anaerotruncus sp.]